MYDVWPMQQPIELVLFTALRLSVQAYTWQTSQLSPKLRRLWDFDKNLH